MRLPKSVFAYQSAEVDWCEKNFVHSEYIAEFFNTISNVAFFILPPMTLWLNAPYSAYRSMPLPCIILMEMAVGIFSMYFHATLSYVGQMLDELGILWTLGMSYSFWYPARYFPPFIKNRNQFIWLVGIVSIISTLMSFVRPVLNAYALNCVALHVVYLTYVELKMCNNPHVHQMGLKMVMWWGAAISCWLVDKFLCQFCEKINFFYFHSLWHVFIAISLTYAMTLVSYFDIVHEMPSTEPDVTYWPSDKSFIAVPHLLLQKPLKWC